MAFSTQKDFLHVAFMNERPEATCLRLEGVKLKTYASTPDERAWSMSKGEQAQYLIDLVACRMYHGGESGDGFREHLSARSPSRTQSGTCVGYETLQGGDNLASGVGDDSVLNAAVGEMSKLEKLLAEKDDLKSQLETSQEQLECYKAEKETINAILNNEHHPEIACDLKNVYNKLQCSGKLDKNEENELKKILCSLIKREKAYKCLDAQNGYLRRLIEKLTLRSQLSTIPYEPECSTDVKYLQCEVNNLRREVTLLRSIEDKQLGKETVSRGCQGTSSINQDADNIAKILAERNALRDKCKSFVAIEGKIVQWKQDSEQLQCLRSDACAAMKKKDEEIQDLQEEIDELQFELQKIEKCCKAKDQEGESLCSSVECLKEENRRLREDICRCNCDLKKITMLQAQVQCLSGELCEKNCIIEQYDMQFQQLLCVIEDLQKKTPCDIRGLQDVDSQTYNKDIELLACSTRDTLDQISKELECQKSLEMENRSQKDELEKTGTALKGSFELFDKAGPPGESCADQVKRLNALIESMQKENDTLKNDIQRGGGGGGSSPEGEAADLKKVRDTNDELNKALQECQAKVKSQEDQINKLNTQAEKLSSELESSKANIKEVGKVVEDISSVKNRNENLQSVVGAVDYQKELADLQKQLENEKKKNSECEAKNNALQTEVTKAKASAEAAAQEAAKAKGTSSADPGGKAAGGAAGGVAGGPAGSAGGSAAGAAGGSGAGAARGSGAGAAGGSGAGAAAGDATADEAARAAANAGALADPKQAKRSSKLAQLQKVHEAQRNAERSKYENEIAGHQMSNEVLRKSLTKITTQLSSQRAIELERELRIVLEAFAQEICKWRCERSMKLNKLQEICKKIIDCGIEYVTYKELVYLHQQLADAAMKLRPKGVSLYMKREQICCKCSGDICQVPMIPREQEKILLDKLAVLEHDIQSARENLRRIKQEQDSTDTDQMDLDTIRPNTYRLNRRSRCSSSQARCKIKEEYDVPTKDRCGY